MYKQLIIARRDLNMSPGKLAAQVSHASIAFLTSQIRKLSNLFYVNRYPAVDKDRNQPVLYRRSDLYTWAKEAFERGEQYFYARPADPNKPYGAMEPCKPDHIYTCLIGLEKGLYEDWINEAMTKVVCGARDKSRLLRAIERAKELGMKEGEDYFLIYDACRTELEPEEENGGTLTCIGFRPMDAEVIDQIGKEYHLY